MKYKNDFLTQNIDKYIYVYKKKQSKLHKVTLQIIFYWGMQKPSNYSEESF